MTPNEAAKKISDQILIGPGELSTLPIIQQAIATATAEMRREHALHFADVRRIIEWLNTDKEPAQFFTAGPEREFADEIHALMLEKRELQAKLDAAEKRTKDLAELLLENAPGTYGTCECAKCQRIRAALKGNGQ